jgi:nicotinate dehydrogenase subunit A
MEYNRGSNIGETEVAIMSETIRFTLNGKPVEAPGDGDRMLLWVLRSDLGHTGTKYGCGEGYCGACTVLVDGEATRSCQTTLKEIQGKSVVTIEGLAREGRLHPLQKAFMEHDALQCGYCTPGMILTAYAFLKKHPHPTADAIVAAMDDNLCRCGAHTRIIQAIQAAAGEMAGGK